MSTNEIFLLVLADVLIGACVGLGTNGWLGVAAAILCLTWKRL